MIAFRPNDKPMFVFHVADMVNHRTAGLVKRVVLALDRHATIQCDIIESRMDVEPSSADAADVVAALKASGLTATVVASTADSAFAWVDSRHSDHEVDSVVGATSLSGLLPAGALGPLAR